MLLSGSLNQNALAHHTFDPSGAYRKSSASHIESSQEIALENLVFVDFRLRHHPLKDMASAANRISFQVITTPVSNAPIELVQVESSPGPVFDIQVRCICLF